ncbi:MAG: hypothetical protein IJZ22_03025 [Bacteroidaceae bacterium]|nr:hypothetical protein [Bacteroidaceae bacterium]
MDRFALIRTKLPREFVLLQGTGCRWGKCTFCNYHNDVSDNPFEINHEVLARVTGETGVLDVINSGSAMELDEQTIRLIKNVVREKNIHTLWFEAHFMYRNKLEEFAAQFAPAKVKFRCGIESFDAAQRKRWNKGVPQWVTAADVARSFSGVCLLCCTDDDTPRRILSDIETAKEYFEYFSVNLFCNNGTAVRRNDELAAWFVQEVYPSIKDDDRVEVLLENTDLGVG